MQVMLMLMLMMLRPDDIPPARQHMTTTSANPV
jgi:hypothetical protein